MMENLTESKLDLRHHDRGITGLDIDFSGSRLASASSDGIVYLWDFAGMDLNSPAPFRRIECFDSGPISCLKYSPQSEYFAVGSASTHYPKCHVYTRDGVMLGATTVGDRYITDLKRTKGHTRPISDLKWHPFNKSQFVTSGEDSTIRIWDTEVAGSGGKGTFLQKQIIPVKSGMRQQRTEVTSCGITGNGKLIAGCCIDGSVKFYAYKGSSSMRPTLCLDEAHPPNSAITSISFSLFRPDLFVTRATDDTCKLWDMRNLKAAAVAVARDLPCVAVGTSAVFAGDKDEYVVTGTCVVPRAPESSAASAGNLVVLDAQTLEETSKCVIPIAKAGGVTRLVWHRRIGQLAVGSSEGLVRVYYNAAHSQRGALLCTAKKHSKARILDAIIASEIAPKPIIAPGSGTTLHHKQQKQLKEDPVSLKTAPGHGGKIGITPLQHLMKDYVDQVALDLVRDPREAILEHAQAAQENPLWVASAYVETQPDSGKVEDIVENVDDDDYAEMARIRLAKKRKM